MRDIDRVYDEAVLEPALSAKSHVVLLSLAAMATILTASAVVFGKSDVVEKPVTISYAADAAAGMVLTTNIDFFEHPEALAGLGLDPLDKKKLLSDVENGSVKIGLLRVWDNVDEDGDRILIESAGYRQEVTLLHKPAAFYVPFLPGGRVKIVAIADGGGGGVTLAATSILGPTVLPPLSVGQALEISVQ